MYRIVGILDECVDGQECQVGLALGIVDQIQVDQLLQLQVVCRRSPKLEYIPYHTLKHFTHILTGLDAVDDVCEKGGHILADGHVGDNLHRKCSLVAAELNGRE
jgi:hypothetical protein